MYICIHTLQYPHTRRSAPKWIDSAPSGPMGHGIRSWGSIWAILIWGTVSETSYTYTIYFTYISEEMADYIVITTVRLRLCRPIKDYIAFLLANNWFAFFYRCIPPQQPTTIETTAEKRMEHSYFFFFYRIIICELRRHIYYYSYVRSSILRNNYWALVFSKFRPPTH